MGHVEMISAQRIDVRRRYSNETIRVGPTDSATTVRCVKSIVRNVSSVGVECGAIYDCARPAIGRGRHFCINVWTRCCREAGDSIVVGVSRSVWAYDWRCRSGGTHVSRHGCRDREVQQFHMISMDGALPANV